MIYLIYLCYLSVYCLSGDWAVSILVALLRLHLFFSLLHLGIRGVSACLVCLCVCVSGRGEVDPVRKHPLHHGLRRQAHDRKVSHPTKGRSDKRYACWENSRADERSVCGRSGENGRPFGMPIGQTICRSKTNGRAVG